jgi:hypothetical protein
MAAHCDQACGFETLVVVTRELRARTPERRSSETDPRLLRDSPRAARPTSTNDRWTGGERRGTFKLALIARSGENAHETIDC